MRTSKGVYALSSLAGISQRPTARNPRSQKKVHIRDRGLLKALFLTSGSESKMLRRLMSIASHHVMLQHSKQQASCAFAPEHSRSSGLSTMQPRRHAVDEGWDGDLNGYPNDGAPDGWAYDDGRQDPYARAEKALARAQADVLEQRERLEKVGRRRRNFEISGLNSGTERLGVRRDKCWSSASAWRRWEGADWI